MLLPEKASGVQVTLSAVVQVNSAKRCVYLELLASIVARGCKPNLPCFAGGPTSVKILINKHLVSIETLSIN